MPHPKEADVNKIVMFIDSNGKYSKPNKLFPSQDVQMLKCRNTNHALELLQKDSLRNTKCVIVHTGTNELHSQKTAREICRVAENASRLFPNSRVVTSTLLPRNNIAHAVIHQINMEITTGCAKLPNVHLVHHTSICLWHLYDGLHINWEGVRAFAKALKDISLGRNPDIHPQLANRRYQQAEPTAEIHEPVQPRPLLRSSHPPRLRRPGTSTNKTPILYI